MHCTDIIIIKIKSPFNLIMNLHVLEKDAQTLSQCLSMELVCEGSLVGLNRIGHENTFGCSPMHFMITLCHINLTYQRYRRHLRNIRCNIIL